MRKERVGPAVVEQRQKCGTQNGSVTTAPASTHITTSRPLFPSLFLYLSDTNVKLTCNAYDCVMLGRFHSVD
jgi:hypothetical protein